MPTTYCRHIRPSGRRCLSPALRSGPFCYYHQTISARHRSVQPPNDGTTNVNYADPRLTADTFKREPLLADYYSQSRSPIEFDFPVLEDNESVQLSVSMVVSALGQNRLDPQRARVMLYALQLASSNARQITYRDQTHTVTETHPGPYGSILSPDEDPPEILETKTFSNAILNLCLGDAEDDNNEDHNEDDNESDDHYDQD